ncbi:hypothetical protein C8R44DRAFT_738935 [Mycena epipterygia]|nr:hypothetical protein C8R44DRAFT_738935 [Mycena epipterygia]
MLSLPRLAGSLALIALSAVAQLPSHSWRKPNITTSLADRVSFAAAAVEKAISMLGPDGQFDGTPSPLSLPSALLTFEITGEPYATAGIFYSQMADLDIATNQTTYQDSLEQYFGLAQQNRGNFSNELSYGYAAARAYTVYKNPIFLQYAIQSWWFGSTYTLSPANIDTGRITGKNFTIGQRCQEATMAGGTFYTTDSTDPEMNGLASGWKIPTRYFAILSALLAEATSDPMYLQAAEASTDFIQAHLCNVQNAVQDSISGRANDSCAVSSLMEPYNSGLMIEGLAILASITQNASTQALLSTIIEAAVVNNVWQGSNGIIANTGHGSEGDISMVRGLGVAYSRNSITPTLRVYVEAYLAVQFNAVIDLATSGDSNIYGAAWIGPPSSVFGGANQTAALSVLLSAITLRNDTSTGVAPTVSGASPSGSFSVSSSASQTPTVSSEPRQTSSRSIAPIVGGVFGGVVLLLVVSLGVWFVRRHPQRDAPQPTSRFMGAPSASEIHPFVDILSSPTIAADSSPSASGSGDTVYIHRKYRPSSTRRAGEPVTVYTTRSKRTELASSAAATEGPSDETAAQRNETHVATPPPSSSALPTEELVRLLNERLQIRPWDQEEAPPDYLALNTR